MDDKQYLIDTVNESALPQEVKDDLISRIGSEGVTKEIAKEVADLLDLQADVLDLESGVAGQKAQAYEDLAKDVETADTQEDQEIKRVLDEAGGQLDDLERQSNQPQAPQPQSPQETQPMAQSAQPDSLSSQPPVQTGVPPTEPPPWQPPTQ